MNSNRFPVFAASLQCTDDVKVVSRGIRRSRTSVTWGLYYIDGLSALYVIIIGPYLVVLFKAFSSIRNLKLYAYNLANSGVSWLAQADFTSFAEREQLINGPDTEEISHLTSTSGISATS